MDDGTIGGTYWDGEDIEGWRGIPVKVLCDRDGKGQLKGVKLGTYNGKPTLELNSRFAIITDRDGGDGPTSRQVSDAAARAAAPAAREPNTPPRQPTPAAQQQPRPPVNNAPPPPRTPPPPSQRVAVRDLIGRHKFVLGYAEQEVRRMRQLPADVALEAADVAVVASICAGVVIDCGRNNLFPDVEPSKDWLRAIAVMFPTARTAPPPPPPARPPAPPVQQELEGPQKEKDDIPF